MPPFQRAFTQMPTFTLLLIVCAVQPDNRIHSTVISKANLVRLQW